MFGLPEWVPVTQPPPALTFDISPVKVTQPPPAPPEPPAPPATDVDAPPIEPPPPAPPEPPVPPPAQQMAAQPPATDTGFPVVKIGLLLLAIYLANQWLNRTKE